MNDKPYLEVSNLNYEVSGNKILQDISFTISKGDILVVIGPNGSGKTTLLKNIIGLYKPTSGEVKLEGKDISKFLGKIAYVPQKFDFDRQTPITVTEFMALESCGKAGHGTSHIADALAKVNMETKAKQRLGVLSGGEFQRMMIARALLHEKEILILDEPAAGIDMAGEETIYNLIADINRERNVTCIIVSHELSVVSRYATTVLCINKSLVCFGPPQEAITVNTIEGLYGTSAALYKHHKH